MSTKVVNLEKSPKEKMSFTQREIKKEKKKERTAIRRYSETQNDDYLRKADIHRKKWMELERNMKVDQETKKAKMKKKNMTEDEAFQEAEKYNLMMKEEGEKKMKMEKEKEKKLQETKTKARLYLKEKKESRKKIQKKKESLKIDFNKEQDNLKVAFYEKVKNEKPNISKADLQKEFRRYQLDNQKREDYKDKIRLLFSLKGLEGEELEQEVENYFEYIKEQKEMFETLKQKQLEGHIEEQDEDLRRTYFPLDFELDDYLQGYKEKMIQDKVSDLEEPISEEEVETHASL
tara:strand:+ start:297 stop:1166 length:870 start_codon:yes stop_codon:yes gene_type:complete